MNIHQIIEFITNNLLLFAALLVVLVMLVKAEYDNQSSRAMRLSPSQTTRLINNHDDALILDIRKRDEFGNGHIRQALNIPLTELKNETDKLKKYRDGQILIYCNSGNTSISAGKILQAAGFTNIYHLEGGIGAWKEAGLPLTKERSKK